MSVAERLNPFPVGAAYAGIYSHGVAVQGGARSVYVSGQVGVRPDGSLPNDFEGQCRQALRNVESVLSAAEMRLDNIVRLGFYLTDRADMDALVEVRKALLGGVAPAITTVIVAGLVSPDWRIEVDAFAASPARQPLLKRLGSV